jgi:hypothetical protein
VAFWSQTPPSHAGQGTHEFCGARQRSLFWHWRQWSVPPQLLGTPSQPASLTCSQVRGVQHVPPEVHTPPSPQVSPPHETILQPSDAEPHVLPAHGFGFVGTHAPHVCVVLLQVIPGAQPPQLTTALPHAFGKVPHAPPSRHWIATPHSPGTPPPPHV